MKKSLLTLFAVSLFAGANAQVVYSSSFETWTSNDPAGWATATPTSLNTDSVVQVTGSSAFGTSAAQLINSTTSHKRLGTTALSITNGQTYEVKFWAKGKGDIRAGIFDGGTGVAAYHYASYISVDTAGWKMFTQNITGDSTSATSAFLLSVKSTTAANGHLQVDSIVVSQVAAPAYSVQQIQYTTSGTGDSPLNNQTISAGGIVTAVDTYTASTGYWIQNGSGAWSGIYVFDQTNASTLLVGDSVTFSALVTEYFNLTELKNVSNFTKVSSGNPALVTAISTSNANMEDYEGVLVKVTGAACNATGLAGNQWKVNDGSGDVFIDDEMFNYPSPIVSTMYDITGIAHYAFSERKIEPRNAADVTINTGIGQVSNTAAVKVYPNPSNGNVTISNVTANDIVNVYDLSGKLVVTEKIAANGNYNFSISKGGMYFVQVNTKDGVRTTKLVVNN